MAGLQVSLRRMARRNWAIFIRWECCLFPNMHTTFPGDYTKRQAYSMKSRDVVVLKPNTVCVMFIPNVEKEKSEKIHTGVGQRM